MPGYEDISVGVRGDKCRGTKLLVPGYARGTRVLVPGYEGGTRVPGYEGISAGVRGY